MKIRKLTIGASAVVLSLLLSCCDLVDFPSPSIPPVSVAEVTTAPSKPDAPPLYCKIGRGTALFGDDWYDFENVEFALYRGQPADVSLTRLHGGQRMVIRALFDGSGQKLIFCPVPGGGTPSDAILDPGRRISCASLYALDDDLHDGIKRTFDIPDAVRGGAISCAYEQDRLRRLRPPYP